MIEAKKNTFDVQQVRSLFPILHQEIEGQPLVYFDNAATTQKPKVVIDAISDYYATINSNVHRGVHHLSQLATDALEQSREKIRKHINAGKAHEVIFTRGTTDSINLVASSLGKGLIKKGDEIIISHLEHHSNIVPWQMLCEQTGARLKVIPVNTKGELIREEFEKLLSDKTRLLAINHISNALGTVNPIKKMIAAARERGAWTFIDGAQAMPHLRVDVQDLDADFYAFSGHKMFGPTGIGILYGKEAILEALPPYQGGGEMIKTVSFEKTTYADLPYKFEAGTPHIEGGIVLGKTVDFINEIGLDQIAAYESELLQYAIDRLSEFDNMRFIGKASERAGAVSFLLGDIHPYDTGMILDKLGIAVRTGHHCTQPLMDFFDIPGTVRASFAFYNTREEVDLMIEGLKRVERMFA